MHIPNTHYYVCTGPTLQRATRVSSRCNRPDQPPTDVYQSIFWTIPGYNLEYTLRYSLGAPRLYTPGYILGASRVGYSLGYRGILWEKIYDYNQL